VKKKEGVLNSRKSIQRKKHWFTIGGRKKRGGKLIIVVEGINTKKENTQNGDCRIVIKEGGA